MAIGPNASRHVGACGLNAHNGCKLGKSPIRLGRFGEFPAGRRAAPGGASRRLSMFVAERGLARRFGRSRCGVRVSSICACGSGRLGRIRLRKFVGNEVIDDLRPGLGALPEGGGKLRAGGACFRLALAQPPISATVAEAAVTASRGPDIGRDRS